MDSALSSTKNKSGNTDAIQEKYSYGPDVINDQPQTIIRGSVEELREMLKQHNKSLKESNKSEENKIC